MLCCHHPLVHIDEAVFGPDAGEFKPKRFLGNDDLKNEVTRNRMLGAFAPSYPPFSSFF